MSKKKTTGPTFKDVALGWTLWGLYGLDKWGEILAWSHSNSVEPTTSTY